MDLAINRRRWHGAVHAECVQRVRDGRSPVTDYQLLFNARPTATTSVQQMPEQAAAVRTQICEGPSDHSSVLALNCSRQALEDALYPTSSYFHLERFYIRLCGILRSRACDPDVSTRLKVSHEWASTLQIQLKEANRRNAWPPP